MGKGIFQKRILGVKVPRLRDALAAVDVEPGMRPAAQHPGAFRRQEPIPHQKRDDPCAEKFLQRSEAHVGHHMKKPAFHEEPVGCERVKVQVEFEVVSPARGPTTDWADIVQVHDDQDIFQPSPDELPAIDIRSL